MRIKFEQLKNNLGRQLQPVYLVCGDEPLQQQEACDSIRKTARAQGFIEREIFHVESGFDWQQFLLSANSMSLFAERKILELRFSTAKSGDAGSKALIEYCGHCLTDNLLLITMPKLEPSSQRSKWFTCLDKTGIVMQVWPIDVAQLPQWINRRMKSLQLQPTREAIQILVDKVEGNMLAAAQEIEKLALYGPATIDVDQIIGSVADDAKYDVFKLVDAAIAGKAKRTAKIVRGLHIMGEEPVYVLWALTRELRTMVNITNGKRRGESLQQMFKKNGVWDKRAPIVTAGVNRFNESQWSSLLQRAIRVDLVIKGVIKGNIWDELLDLCLAMSGKTPIKYKMVTTYS